MYELGFFVQDDWRVTARLVLNLGLRYDFYSNMVARPTGEVPVGFYNLAPPKDWSKFDFGPPLDPEHPYNNDGWVNLGPRIGFAYRLDDRREYRVARGFRRPVQPPDAGSGAAGGGPSDIPFRVSWSLERGTRAGAEVAGRTRMRWRGIVEEQISSVLGAVSVLGHEPRASEPLRHALPVQHPARS